MLNNVNAAFADAFALPSRVAIYIPSTTDTNHTADNSRLVEYVAATLSRLFGGATSQSASGFWMSDKCGLVAEAVTIVYANATPEALDTHAATLRNIAERIKTEMRQEAVSVEINGTLFIV